MASAQLELIYSDSGNWKLDRRTVEIGRAGLAQARAALAAANAPEFTDTHTFGVLPFEDADQALAA